LQKPQIQTYGAFEKRFNDFSYYKYGGPEAWSIDPQIGAAHMLWQFYQSAFFYDYFSTLGNWK